MADLAEKEFAIFPLFSQLKLREKGKDGEVSGDAADLG